MQRAKLVDGKELHFPGSKEKYQQTLEKYRELLAKIFGRKLKDDELEELGLNFNRLQNFDLPAVIGEDSDDRYRAAVKELLDELKEGDSEMALLTLMQDDKVKAMLRDGGKETDLVNYIKYLVGE
jgi:hypothetical protein